MAVKQALALVAILVTWTALVAAIPADAQELRFSGHVVGKDPGGVAILVEELAGARGNMPLVMQRALMVGADARVVVVERVRDPGSGWSGDYRETPVTRQDVKPGDFVTVSATRRGGMLHAVSIAIMRPDGR